MKMKSLAVAVSSALAALVAVPASAQTTISGNVDVGLQGVNHKGNSIPLTATSSGSSTSAMQFKGTEEIQKGLNLNWQFEVSLDFANTGGKTAGTSAVGPTSNVPQSIGNGASWLEISSAQLGSLKLGTPNIATLSANGDGNVGFGTGVGAGYRTVSFDAVRFQNSWRYDTPNLNGFGASLVMVPKNDKQTGATALGNSQNQVNGRDAVRELGLSYAQGPLTVRYVDLQTKQFAQTSNGTTALTLVRGNGEAFNLRTLSTKYDVNKELTVAYIHQRTGSDILDKANATSGATTPSDLKYDRKSHGFAGSYTMGANKFMLNRVRVSIGDETGTSSTDATKTSLLSLGLDHSLSKRTTAYIRNENIKDLAAIKAITGYTAVGGSTTYKQFAVGVRHTF